MAKTKITGIASSVSLPTGFNGHFRSFDYDLAFPEQETTGFEDLGFYSGVPVGGIRHTGTVNGLLNYDAANTQPFPDAFADGAGLALGDLAGLSAAGTFTFTTGCTLAGTYIISGISGSLGANTTAEANWRYGSTGPLTIVWDET